MATISTRVSALEVRMQKAEARLTALETRAATTDQTVAALDARVTALESAVPEPPVIEPPDNTPYTVMQGSYIPAVPWDTVKWDTWDVMAGKKQGLVHYGQSWWEGSIATPRYRPWYTNVPENVRLRGAIPVIDWSPWDTSAPVLTEQPTFSLAQIAAGTHDAYIATWAKASATWAKPYFMRPMHEMNGTWYPWSEINNGNQPGEYVKAWRHIVDIFRANNANNVTWVWCVNAIYPGSLPIAGLYPGDDYVDWASIDAYSGGKFGDLTFEQMLRPTYDAIGKLTNRPIMLAEWGRNMTGAPRPAWLKDALARVFTFPRLRAICYFNWNSEAGATVELNDAESQQAYREGLADPRYTANNYTSLPAGKIQPPAS